MCGIEHIVDPFNENRTHADGFVVYLELNGVPVDLGLFGVVCHSTLLRMCQDDDVHAWFNFVAVLLGFHQPVERVQVFIEDRLRFRVSLTELDFLDIRHARRFAYVVENQFLKPINRVEC